MFDWYHGITPKVYSTSYNNHGGRNGSLPNNCFRHIRVIFHPHFLLLMLFLRISVPNTAIGICATTVVRVGCCPKKTDVVLKRGLYFTFKSKLVEVRCTFVFIFLSWYKHKKCRHTDSSTISPRPPTITTSQVPLRFADIPPIYPSASATWPVNICHPIEQEKTAKELHGEPWGTTSSFVVIIIIIINNNNSNTESSSTSTQSYQHLLAPREPLHKDGSVSLPQRIDPKTLAAVGRLTRAPRVRISLLYLASPKFILKRDLRRHL